MPTTATYSSVLQRLTVTGDSAAETMIITRDAAGALFVNGGAVAVTGGTPTVANTSLIVASGGDGDDTITLDEAGGTLPAAELAGGNGADSLTGGSNGDTLLGEVGSDILAGRGGSDLLFGGADSDTLNGGDGDDQMFGENGNDRMIWNPGDDNDLMEGGADADTAEINGGGGGETFTITANGARVRFDRVDPAPFAVDIGTTEFLILNAGGGNDSVSATGNLAALIALTLDGGAGDDTIFGGNGSDTLIGGEGVDFVDGQQGNDTAFLGAGNDTFQWDPGDGSDIVEGQADTDTLLFNGSAGNEIFGLSANGVRALLTRNVANIVMDVNGLESFTVNALGGSDTFIVNDLSGTDAATIAVNLAGTIGGTAGDAAVDIVVVNGTNSADTINVTGAGTSVHVSGLPASIAVTNAEGANDSLTVNGLGGIDNIIATTLAAGVVRLNIDGGAGADTILGSQGADTILGGDDGDFVFGDNGNDAAFLGAGDDVFEWAPGDGNDVVEGQAGTDELRFNGANASENINISANGGRLLFLRDIANVTMDMDDVERIRYHALGGADNIIVNDLSGTDATQIELRLAASLGGGDGAIDTVTVNGTNAVDVIAVSSPGGVVTVSGLPSSVSIHDAEGVNDRLTLNGLGGDDAIDAGALAVGLVALTVNGGLGNDVIVGSAGNDIVVGGDGNDTALLGGGDDSFVWNPGDDNDVIEGQAGADALQFNGANVAENITIFANGGRTTFFRDIANVTMDLNDTEVIRFAALGGADNITVDDLAGTDVTQLVLDLAGTLGGASGDAQADIVTLRASAAANTIAIGGTAAALAISGLPWSVILNQVETADALTIFGGEGDDFISTAGLANALVVLSLDGGGGNDVLHSTGDGTYRGGTGDDLILAGLTNLSEILDGGGGVDTLDTTSWSSIYTINMITGVTNFSSESFVNFENLISGSGNDTITGTTVANIIRTGAGTDNVTGGDGDDIIEGGAGGDTLNGGANSDTLDYSSSNAAVTILLTTNSVSGGHATGDVISLFENLTGSAHTDSLTGDGSSNILNGGLDADTLTGLGGNDFLVGGVGADVMVGGTGDDTYYVDDTSDAITELSTEGNDRIAATITLALAADANIERIEVVNLTSTNAIDLTGSAIGNIIYGNDGQNILRGEAGNDELRGFGGSDFLVGGTGTDLMVGGAGDDTFYVDDALDAIGEIAGEGNDRIAASVSFVLSNGANVELLEAVNLTATTAFDLTGSDSANTITGNNGVNILRGEGGNDILSSAGGDDFLVGGSGVDAMTGGSGNDTYYVDEAADMVFEIAGEGTNDRVSASASYALAGNADVERLESANQSATDAMNLFGSNSGNAIGGNNGVNFLDGRGGNDVLTGLGGADSYAFSTTLGAGNVDTVVGFVSASDRMVLYAAIFAGLPIGALNPNTFKLGSQATEADDRIIYNQATGQLFYDADGDFGGAAVQFATLGGNPVLVASDFTVI